MMMILLIILPIALLAFSLYFVFNKKWVSACVSAGLLMLVVIGWLSVLSYSYTTETSDDTSDLPQPPVISEQS
jgi:energy-converting hydrogenase Eha subunit G